MSKGKKNQKHKDLPASSDKEFWGEDAEMHVIDTSNPEQHFDLLKGTHDWKQQGPFLMCNNCALGHSVYIGMEKQLIGVGEEGNPILRKVTDST